MGQAAWVLGTAAVSGAAGVALGWLGARVLSRSSRGSRAALTFLPLGAGPEDVSGVVRRPDWKAPEKQPPPFPLEPVLSFDPELLDSSVLYPLVISAVVPRPIAFISTLSKNGTGNLSPYSYFNAVSHNPPVLAIGHCWSKGAPKDSLQNILDTGEMVVSIISKWFVEAANHTCGPYDRGVNEMELSGLTPVPSEKVKPPRVAESAINMEAKLLHHYDLRDKSGNVTCTVVLAEVVLMHVAEPVTTKTPNSGKTIVDPVKLQPVCRLGGNTFGVDLDFFDIPRPDKDGRYPGAKDFTPSDRDRILGKK